jgi:hypothetical protein
VEVVACDAVVAVPEPCVVVVVWPFTDVVSVVVATGSVVFVHPAREMASPIINITMTIEPYFI